ncbi:MAG: succinylglutamate desuccinylase/aspartoacylase family protein [Candidatus Baltobacteraceae bacterium]
MATDCERPPYAALEAAWNELARTRGLRPSRVAVEGGGRPLLQLEVARGLEAPWVALSAGVHGDEPAAPWALLSIVRDGLLDEAFAYRIWCCTNPSGYERGTRANAAGDDINRSFSQAGRTPEARAIVAANEGRRFALSLDLHEDFEARGFYCYEPVVGGRAPYGPPLVQAIEDAGFGVQELSGAFDLGYPPEANALRVLERGRCLPNVAAELRYFDGLPYSMYMISRHAERTLTLESPRHLPWEDRIAIHRTAVVALLAQLRTIAR